MSAAFVLWQKHIYKFWNSRAEVAGTLLSPILWVALFGAGMGALISPSMEEVGNYKSFLAPGIIALTALTGSIVGGATLLDEKLRGILKEYLVAPVPRWSIVVGSAASSTTKALAQALLIFGVSLAVGAEARGNGATIALGFALLAAYSLGFVGLALGWAMRAPTTAAYHALIFLFNLPLLFASTALYPLSVLPTWLRVLAEANPTSYVIDALRRLMFEGAPAFNLALSISVVCAFALFGLAVGYLSFRASPK